MVEANCVGTGPACAINQSGIASGTSSYQHDMPNKKTSEVSKTSEVYIYTTLSKS